MRGLHERITSRAWAITLVLASSWIAASTAANTPPSALPAHVLRDELARGDRTAEAVTRHFLARIEAFDDRYRSVLAVAPDALDQARRLDERFASEGPVGPLHGLPVLIKDNIETRELPTTAGSLALADSRTERDAPLVARLRHAGAVILGKTNLSEWANFRSNRSSSGWSAVGGQTGNAIDPDRSPCGSSAGSAVAVALAFAPLAVGTETNGSIVCPASANGIVGFKPTVGVVSRRGIVPITMTQDTAGPMARDVTGTWLLLQAMAGADDDDPMAALAAGTVLDGAPAPADARTLRLGILRSATGYHEGVDALFDQALARLRAAGITIVDDLAIGPPPGFGAATHRILIHEFDETIDRYLAALPPPRNRWTLEDLIAFNEAHAEEELRWFGQELFEETAAYDPAGSPSGDALADDPSVAERQHGTGDPLPTRGGDEDSAGEATGERAATDQTTGEPLRPEQASGLPAGAEGGGGGTGLPAYAEALVLARAATRDEGLDRLLAEHDLDALLAPTDGPAWMIDLVNGDHFGGGFSTYPAVAGYPHLTLPMGRVHGLPIGLSVTAGAREDRTVLAIGLLLEQLDLAAGEYP